jgi:hypothetical protein
MGVVLCSETPPRSAPERRPSENPGNRKQENQQHLPVSANVGFGGPPTPSSSAGSCFPSRLYGVAAAAETAVVLDAVASTCCQVLSVVVLGRRSAAPCRCAGRCAGTAAGAPAHGVTAWHLGQ